MAEPTPALSIGAFSNWPFLVGRDGLADENLMGVRHPLLRKATMNECRRQAFLSSKGFHSPTAPFQICHSDYKAQGQA